MSEKTQLLPFPMPEFLSRFIASKLKSPIETLPTGHKVKALKVSNATAFGKMIARSLNQADRPKLNKGGYQLYIRVSHYLGDQDRNVASGRDLPYNLSEEGIADITDVFETYYYDCFYEHVDGAVEQLTKMGKKRGAQHHSIRSFMHKYGTSENADRFEVLKKRYHRYKKGKTNQFMG